MFAPTERAGGKAVVADQPLYLALVIIAELGIFAYLGWAFWRTKQLKRRRAAVDARMSAERPRGDVGHSLAPTV
jgi:hypothetical protein